MNVTPRVWRERPFADDVAQELTRELGLGPVAARILAGRGVLDVNQASGFLAKRLADIHDPARLQGMDAAARRLAKAIDQRETILIHGDYDVDGSTATTLLTLFVRSFGHRAVPWIPDRRIDGYGLSEASLAAVREQQAQLMITVDCGIADHGWAQRIEADAGCDVIITDHHLPQGALPNCHAVVNPNQPGCTYPDKGLAGVGVAWKLAWATARQLTGSDKLPAGLREFLMDSLALVAIGTVADCAPLDGENRILVHHGLKYLGQTRNPGLRALLDEARVGPQPTVDDIGWRMAPLLNASGRLGSAMRNVHLLSSQNSDEAAPWMAEISRENTERRRISQLLSEELCAEVELHPQRYAQRASLVFAGEGWHPGVVGIIASRLTEAFAKPSVVIAINEGEGKGSLRTIPSIHLGHALDACRQHLIKGGGHAMAAGLTIAPENVPAFSEAFDMAVRSQSPGGLCAPGIDYDGRVRIRDLTPEFYADLLRLGPFGQGNPEPLLRLQGARFLTNPQFFGRSSAHLRGALTDDGGGMQNFLVWKAVQILPGVDRHSRLDVLVRPQIDWFRGNAQHRLVMVDGGAARA
ncbi:MAG: single-stranded-DNA-specific exonuclease RecJ [Planctomycetota bacterium]|nr:MAG: single-stranded-DNA-specific exonuclease RecJ [Planctomycetota bacterium]